MSNLRENSRSKKSVKLKVKNRNPENKKGRSFYAAAFVYNDYSINRQIPRSKTPRPQTKSLVAVSGRYA